jgi:hypothetical protein
MRKILGAVAAAALMGTASLAYAASTTGDISSLNRNARTLSLDNGPTFVAPRTAKLSNFKVGEKVRVAYSIRGSGLGYEHASSITPAQPAANDADVGG